MDRGRGRRSGLGLWALGALLYEMLAGVRPFEGERRAAVLHAVVHEEPAPITKRRPEVPAAIVRVVRRCLEKDPADRYGSAAALREDLGKVRSGTGSSPGAPQSAPSGPGRLADLPRRWIAGGAALLVVLALVGAWWLFPRFPDEALEEPAVKTPAPAETSRPVSRDRPFVAVLPLENPSPE
jgi:serine/threonine-protein kinase